MPIRVRPLVLLLCAAVAAACSPQPPAPVPAPDAVPAPAPRLLLEQNWSQAVREGFWFTSQGSRLLPLAWFKALRTADGRAGFTDAATLDAFGYLPMPASAGNPDGLPIGFARDDRDVAAGGVAWVGPTCAACHTGQIDWNGQHLLIDGAPTLADFDGLVTALVVALEATVADPGRFGTFATAVLGSGHAAAAAGALRDEVTALAAALGARRRIATPAGPHAGDLTGHGRLDAFGNIENEVTAFALGDPANGHAADAPVSYPFLWGSPQSDVVQWNGSAGNTPGIGPLVRNVGEVVGVFGGLSITREAGATTARYATTADLEGLGLLERWIVDLRAPHWPDVLPPIDAALAAEGAPLYDQHCAGCHARVAPDAQGKPYPAKMVPVDVVGTDPAMALNPGRHVASTGALAGLPAAVFTGPPLPDRARSIELAVHAVVGALLADPVAALRAQATSDGAEPPPDDPAAATAELQRRIGQHLRAAAGRAGPPAYKARPLNGIWATAPYLHNGSVPNLWQLLLPPDQRAATFHVGARAFDPVDVGFVHDRGPTVFRVHASDGTPIPGNGNGGHAFGTTLDDRQRRALVEHLKTL